MSKFISLFLFLYVINLTSGQEIKIQPVFPEIIKGFPTVRDFTISPNQMEAYFTMQGYNGELSTIIRLKKENEKWSGPEVAPFSGTYTDLEPMFSPDGLKLFFVSNRPLKESDTVAKDQDIWYIERLSEISEWSKPKNLGTPVNTEGDEFYPSIASNGNLYFTSTGKGTKGKDDIFMSQWNKGKYLPPVSLSSAINTEGFEYNAYIAPDESYLIFGGYQRQDGQGSGDLYISIKNKEGIWLQSENLTAINSDKMDYCPYYDLNTNTLYFTSKRSDLPSEFDKRHTLREILEVHSLYQNGLSRIYSVKINLNKNTNYETP